MELIIFVLSVLGLLFLTYAMAYLAFSRKAYAKGLIKGYEEGYKIGFDDGYQYKNPKKRSEEFKKIMKMFEDNKYGVISLETLNVTPPTVKKIVKKKES